MMRHASTLRLASVDRDSITRALGTRGLVFREVGHVCAVATHASRIMEDRIPAIAIARLIDLIVVPGYPTEYHPVRRVGYPSADRLRSDEEEYHDARLAWQRGVGAVRRVIALQFDDALRRFRAAHPGEPNLDALFAARATFQATVNTLAMTGIRPDALRPLTEEGVWARRAWMAIEEELPVLGVMREDLWHDTEALLHGSTEAAKGLASRVEAALTAVFGEVRGPRTIVHHGFYFYTPPQWALFRLLDVLGVRQVFIMHDDGLQPAFGVWRRFFRERWGFDPPERFDAGRRPTTAATILADALAGRTVDAGRAAGHLRVIRARNASDLTQMVLRARDEAGETGDRPGVYAADDERIARIVGRLAAEHPSEEVELSKLPVGVFLLRVHESIDASPDGGVRLRLSPEALRDIVGSGLLSIRPEDMVLARRVLERALPFFDDCAHPDDWDRRARHLEALVMTVVDPVSPQLDDDDTPTRLRKAVENPFRRASWLDLSAREVALVREAITQATEAIRRFGSEATVDVRKHLADVEARLRHESVRIPVRQLEVLEARCSQFAAGPIRQLDVGGLEDLVRLILASRVPSDGDADDETQGVRPLRSLSALGYRRTDASLLLTNLADGAFPAMTRTGQWPFTGEEVRAAASEEAAALLATREETAPLGDLYLLWLALDGIEEGRSVTLSWLERLGGEERSMSALLSLLTEPPRGREEAFRLVGGLPIEYFRPPRHSTSESSSLPLDPVRGTPEAITGALGRLPHQVLASIITCPRRFALQWVLGPSGAFTAPFQHQMLLGNVMAALQTDLRFPEAEARRLTDELWRQLTAAERESSRKRRVVRPPGAIGATSAWLLTLHGKMDGTDATSKAYRALRTGIQAEGLVDGVRGGGLLPARGEQVTATDCMRCPMRSRCTQALTKE